MDLGPPFWPRWIPHTYCWNALPGGCLWPPRVTRRPTRIVGSRTASCSFDTAGWARGWCQAACTCCRSSAPAPGTLPRGRGAPSIPATALATAVLVPGAAISQHLELLEPSLKLLQNHKLGLPESQS